MMGCGEEGLGETSPCGVSIEREEKFDSGSSHQWRQEGINGTVNVVERQHVQQIVVRCIFPSFDQRPRLCADVTCFQ